MTDTGGSGERGAGKIEAQEAARDRDFTDQLNRFKERPDAQPQEASDRAAEVVIRAIRLYPQHNDGAQWIIAWRVLRHEFYTHHSSPATPQVTMEELARMAPDMSMCWHRMNEAHDTFKVGKADEDEEDEDVDELHEEDVELGEPDEDVDKPRQRPDVTPARAAFFVCNFAVYTLEVVHDITITFMRQMGIPINDLGNSVRMRRLMVAVPWDVDFEVVDRIHTELSKNAELRKQVYDHIAQKAKQYIERSMQQQAKYSPVARKRLARKVAKAARAANPDQPQSE